MSTFTSVKILVNVSVSGASFDDTQTEDFHFTSEIFFSRKILKVVIKKHSPF